ncbi:MAG: PIN domain-containing protein [Candidatus Rokuibacteriota bacterium]
MIGIDTDVLVRYLTLDDAEQVERVDRLIEEALERDEALHVDGIVLCEAAWVLRTAYGLPRSDVADALERILATRQFAIEDRDSVRRALDAFVEGRGDFADYLIGERNRRAGCRTTMTFDRSLAESALFAAL